MSLQLLERPVESPAETGGEQGTHIACWCSQEWAFCGKYDPAGITDERPVSEEDCAMCLIVWHHGECPRCGCRDDDWCAKCVAGAAR